MIVNISRTWEMVPNEGVSKQFPPEIDGIKREKQLKRLGVGFQGDPCLWELHIKASGRMYILRVCIHKDTI